MITLDKEIENFLDEPIFFALVLKGKYRDFLDLKKLIQRNKNVHIIYQKPCSSMLWIVDKKPDVLSQKEAEKSVRT